MEIMKTLRKQPISYHVSSQVLILLSQTPRQTINRSLNPTTDCWNHLLAQWKQTAFKYVAQEAGLPNETVKCCLL